MILEEFKKTILEADLYVNLIREMYISKEWNLPDALKFKHPNEISDLFLMILMRMLENDEIVDNREYSDMTSEIKKQICDIMINDIYIEMGPE